jgi:tetrahydromethanopterin S-methyltransferase subunit A
MSDEPAPAWPPLVGDVVFGSPESPVAVCTLASRSLLPSLAGRPEIAIAGRVYTENVGVERMIQNVVANPRLRVLLLCGRESSHRVGQTILSLHENGLDAEKRVIGAGSPEPFLPNLRADELRAFRERVRIVDLIGELDPERILERARACADDAGAGQAVDAGGTATAPGRAAAVERIRATPDARADWRYDRTGFFLIFVERASRTLRVEHYSRGRELLRIVEGRNAEELCHTLVRHGLVTELAHAAYLGRELARAEDALHLGLHYEQDSALRRSGT